MPWKGWGKKKEKKGKEEKETEEKEQGEAKRREGGREGWRDERRVGRRVRVGTDGGRLG